MLFNNYITICMLVCCKWQLVQVKVLFSFLFINTWKNIWINPCLVKMIQKASWGSVSSKPFLESAIFGQAGILFEKIRIVFFPKLLNFSALLSFSKTAYWQNRKLLLYQDNQKIIQKNKKTYWPDWPRFQAV